MDRKELLDTVGGRKDEGICLTEEYVLQPRFEHDLICKHLLSAVHTSIKKKSVLSCVGKASICHFRKKCYFSLSLHDPVSLIMYSISSPFDRYLVF